MKQRAFGAAGTTLPIIGQGTWHLESDGDAVRSLQLGLDLGMTHIDTAEMYGSGAAEKIVGRAMSERRDEVFLVSKVLPSNASRKGTVKACEDSLERLATDRIDLYLLHWPGSYPLEETFSAMETLRRDGKIRAFGVSNFDVSDLESLASAVDITQVACNQVLYNPIERTIENGVLPWCRAHAIPIVAYTPFGDGGLPGNSHPAGKALIEMGHRYGVSPNQIALCFVTRAADVFAIPKAAREEHLRQNAAAGALELSADDLRTLEAVLPAPAPGSPLPIL